MTKNQQQQNQAHLRAMATADAERAMAGEIVELKAADGASIVLVRVSGVDLDGCPETRFVMRDYGTEARMSRFHSLDARPSITNLERLAAHWDGFICAHVTRENTTATTTESPTILAMREMHQAMAAWEKADEAATKARKALWAVEPLDPRRDQLRAERDAAMAAEDEAAAAYRKVAKRYREAVTAERFSR